LTVSIRLIGLILFIAATPSFSDPLWVRNRDARIIVPVKPFVEALEGLQGTTYEGHIKSPYCGLRINLDRVLVAPRGLFDFATASQSFILDLQLHASGHAYDVCSILNASLSCEANVRIGPATLPGLGNSNCKASINLVGDIPFTFPVPIPPLAKGLGEIPVTLSKADPLAEEFISAEFGEVQADGAWQSAPDPKHRIIPISGTMGAISPHPAFTPIGSSGQLQLNTNPSFVVLDITSGRATFQSAADLKGAMTPMIDDLPKDDSAAQVEISTSLFGVGSTILSRDGIFGSLLPVRVVGRKKVASNVYLNYTFVISGGRVGLAGDSVHPLIVGELRMTALSCKISSRPNDAGEPVKSRVGTDLQVAFSVPRPDPHSGDLLTELRGANVSFSAQSDRYSGVVILPEFIHIFEQDILKVATLNGKLPIQLPDCLAMPDSPRVDPEGHCASGVQSGLSNLNTSLASTITLHFDQITGPNVNRKLGRIVYSVPISLEKPSYTRAPRRETHYSGPLYRIAQVPELKPGLPMLAHYMDDDGRIAGTGYLRVGPNSIHHAVLVDQSGVHDLEPAGSKEVSEALSITSDGTVIGWSGPYGGARRGVQFASGSKQDIKGLENVTALYAANSAGDMIGAKAAGYFLFHGGRLSYFGTLGGRYSWPNALNRSDQVVGQSELKTKDRHPFLYDGTMHDLGVLGASNDLNTASRISDNGYITGETSVNGAPGYHAFVYSAGTMHDLGVLAGGQVSGGAAVNSLGDVVGGSEVGGGGNAGFLYTSGMMLNLNDLISQDEPLKSHVTFGTGALITDSHKILAVGLDSRDDYPIQHLYVLTPAQ
jgi:probable HAF family extracellular repeat protein